MRTKQILRIALDGFTVLTVIAAVSAIGALYALTDSHRRIAWWLGGIVVVWAMCAVTFQMFRLIKKDRTAKRINEMLAEGQRLAVAIKAKNPNEEAKFFPKGGVGSQEDQKAHDQILGWTNRVETLLRERLDEGYVDRFHFGGSLEQDKTHMTLWKTW